MRIAICDDEKKVREQLGEMIKNIYPQTEVAFYRIGEELLAEQCMPDIVFLDIQMPGKNGMDTAAELRKKDKNTILIFITAIEEYVFQAFDVGAFHYLVKPFTDDKFLEVLTNAVNEFCDRKYLNEADEKYIMIHTKGSHVKVLLKDIVYAEVFNRKIIIHKTDGDLEYYGKLSELEKTLGDDFYRPHRAYLIHFKYVVRYNASAITMENGTALLAKANFSEFVRKYLKYNQKKGKEVR